MKSLHKLRTWLLHLSLFNDLEGTSGTLLLFVGDFDFLIIFEISVEKRLKLEIV